MASSRQLFWFVDLTLVPTYLPIYLHLSVEDVRRGVSQQEVSEPGAEDLPQLTFDRPFLYSLVHTHSGEIFLAGIVRDPSSP